jgi:hypothetical protein
MGSAVNDRQSADSGSKCGDSAVKERPPVTLTITQAHIDATRHRFARRLCAKCPAWQAAEEAGIDGIRGVTPHLIHFGGPRRDIPLPPVATAWILAFDAGRPAEPITFEVEA